MMRKNEKLLRRFFKGNVLKKCEMARDYDLKSVVYSLNYVLKNVIAGY